MSTAWRLLHFHDVLILRSSSNRSISQITEHWYFINVDHGFIFEPALIFFLVFCLLLLFKVCRNCVESFVGKASFHSTYFIPCHLSITYGGVPRWFPCLYIWLTTCQHHCQVQCHSVLPAKSAITLQQIIEQRKIRATVISVSCHDFFFPLVLFVNFPLWSE